MAIKCYSGETKNTSIFFAYVDGFKNKRTINIPITPKDLLPILETYLEDIDNQIIEISTPTLLDFELSPDGIPSDWDQYLRDSITPALSYYNKDLIAGVPAYQVWEEMTDQSDVWGVPNSFIVNDLGDKSGDDMLHFQITNPTEVETNLNQREPVTIKLKFIQRLKG